MKHINLTIPDVLYERYQRHKHRMNLSALCAELLEAEITKLERPESILLCPACGETHQSVGAGAGERVKVRCFNGHVFDPFTRMVEPVEQEAER